TLDIGYDHETEEHRYGGLSFRAASSLLIAEGCFDGETHVSKGEPQDCGRRYYNWNGTKFTLLQATQASGVPLPSAPAFRSPPIRSAVSGPPGPVGRSTAWTPSSTRSCWSPHSATFSPAPASLPIRPMSASTAAFSSPSSSPAGASRSSG